MDTSNIREKRMNSKQEYAKAKADFEELYANADDDTRAKIEGLMRSSLNYSSANPMNNRSAREYQTQIYKNATDIMNGKITPATAGIVSTPNWFNGYSHEENRNNANYVTNRYLDGNGAIQSKPSTSGASAPAGSGSFHRYNWAKGLESGWALDTDTLDDRMKSFASALTRNLSEAAGASKAGKKLIGIGDNEISQALALLNRTDWNKDSFKSLMEAAKIAGVDPQWFMDYFDGLVPGSDPISKNKAERTKTGYLDVDLSTISENIKKALGTNRLMKHKDTGEYKLFGSDYSDYTGNAFDWVDLNQGDTYGNGIVVDNTGRAFLGDIRTIKDEGNAYKDLYDAVMERRKNYNQAFMRKKFNLDNDYSESNLVNEFIKQRSTARPNIKDISYTDVSKMFGGNNLVLAYNDDGTELGQGDFGELILNPNTKFVWQDAEGKIHYGNFEQAKQNNGEFRYNGFDNEDIDQAGLLYDTSDVFKGVKGISGDTNLVSRNWKRVLEAGTVGAGVGAAAGAWAGPGALIGALGGFATGAVVDLITQYYNNDTIANKPQAFVDSAIKALKDPNKKIEVQGINMTGSQFLAQFESREQLLATIGTFIQSKQVTLSPEDKKMIRNLYLDLSEEAQGKLRAHKLGGILLAADGYKVYTQEQRNRNNWHEKYDKTQALKKEDADIAAAKADGYDDVNKWRANKSTTLTTADAFRFATMAQDAASIVAAFMPGAGTGVAAGLGVTALGTDLVADIMDPAISAGEVLKNAGMNAGFAALGMIPGAKMTKVVKNIVKYAPKIITAAAGLGIAMDESTQNTFKKITSGKEKLNREDWRNLSHVLSLVAAGTRGVKGDIARRKVGKGIVAGENVKLKGVKNAEGNDFELPKNKVKEINDELAKVKTTEELATIREKYSLPEEAIKAPLIKEGKLSGKYKLVDTESTKNSDATYDNLREIWNQETRDVENSSKLGRWFANKFGGGYYTAKQRAILENLENDNLREYTGKYNPMIDWQNLRKTAGAARMKARYTSPEVKDNGPIISSNNQLALPAYKPELAPIERRNPAIERSYNVQREAAKKVSSPVEIKAKAPKLESLTAGAQLIGPSGQRFSVVGIRNTRWGKRINLIDNTTKQRVTIAPENLERYQLVQTQVGENGNLLIPFKDGGKVNYQKLRK